MGKSGCTKRNREAKSSARLAEPREYRLGRRGGFRAGKGAREGGNFHWKIVWAEVGDLGRKGSVRRVELPLKVVIVVVYALNEDGGGGE